VPLFPALLAASCNVPARPGTCDTPTTFTLGDEAMFSMRVTPACWRAALVVAIVGITYNQDSIELYVTLYLKCYRTTYPYKHNILGFY
jgi:hypothetical protein